MSNIRQRPIRLITCSSGTLATEVAKSAFLAEKFLLSSAVLPTKTGDARIMRLQGTSQRAAENLGGILSGEVAPRVARP